MIKLCLYRYAFVFLPLQLFEIANKYHFYHSLALLGAAHCRKPAVVSISASSLLLRLDSLERSLKLKLRDSIGVSSLRTPVLPCAVITEAAGCV